MIKYRSILMIVLCAILAGGMMLAFSILQLLNHVPALIGSVSWNL